MKDNRNSAPMDVQYLLREISSLSRCRHPRCDERPTSESGDVEVDKTTWNGLSGRVCCDSRQVSRGDVFVAVRGRQVDGHDFIPQAMEKGAAVIVSEKDVQTPAGVVAIKVSNSQFVLGELAQAWAGEPARQLTRLAVTGTNGKTTVAYLVRHILNRAGVKCGMIGTVEYDLGGGEIVAAGNTTPGAVELAELMRKMGLNGLPSVVMECSSHGLDQGRVAGIDFTGAAFTNLSGDHQDYHGNMQLYLEAKSRLFTGLEEYAAAVINTDDPAGQDLAGLARGQLWRYGFDLRQEISGRMTQMNLDGTQFELSMFNESAMVNILLIGRYNIYNCLAAAGLVRAAGVGFAEIVEGLSSFTGVPGRLERVDAGQPFTVFVDYAHTDDALDHVLRCLHGLKGNRLIVVFGCGGDRDQDKRPRMAQVAERWADVVIVTDDNPREEDPEQIMDQIRVGFSLEGYDDKVMELPDRYEAISCAIEEAHPDDVILIAGKGHEDYQIIGSEKRTFDDRLVAREILHKRF